MNADDLDRSFGFLLYDTGRLFRRSFDRRARTLGLTRAQWSVLAHIHRKEGCKQALLADLLDVEPITLARLLDRLEAAGWVERRADPADRRVRCLYLTDKARPLVAQLRRLGAEAREEAMAGLTAAERDTLIELLTRVRGNLCCRDAAPTGEPRDKP